MRKGDRELFKLIERLGLSVIGNHVGRHRKLVVRRSDGAAKLVTVSLSPSDGRAQLNIASELRSFATRRDIKKG